MVRSILYPSVKCMRQEMLIKEGYQVLHNCAFVRDSREEKELNVKPKTLEGIRTELGVCRSPVFCCNSQLIGGDNHVNFLLIIMKFQVGCWIYKRLIIVAWKIVFCFLQSCLVVQSTCYSQFFVSCWFVSVLYICMCSYFVKKLSF